MIESAMNFLDEFREIARADEPLALHTWLKVGGPAEWLIEPRSVDELQAVARRCFEENVPLRMLGGGSNVLAPDEGVRGVVLRLAHESFQRIEVEGTLVRAAGGALLSHVVSTAVKAGLAGMEGLVGIPGTVGGALRSNSGTRHGDVGQCARAVTVVTAKGEKFIRREDELTFAYRHSSINELAVVDAEFELAEDNPDEIARRMRKLWIMKKASQPLSFQSAGCIFKNPRGLSAGALIEQAGLKGTRVGRCEISDRHANFIVTEEGCTAADVRELIDLVRDKVQETFGVELELEICAW